MYPVRQPITLRFPRKHRRQQFHRCFSLTFATRNETPAVELSLVRKRHFKIGRRLARIPFGAPAETRSDSFNLVPQSSAIFFEPPVLSPGLQSNTRVGRLCDEPDPPEENGEYSTG